MQVHNNSIKLQSFEKRKEEVKAEKCSTVSRSCCNRLSLVGAASFIDLKSFPDLWPWWQAVFGNSGNWETFSISRAARLQQISHWLRGGTKNVERSAFSRTLLRALSRAAKSGNTIAAWKWDSTRIHLLLRSQKLWQWDGYKWINWKSARKGRKCRAEGKWNRLELPLIVRRISLSVLVHAWTPC